MSQPDRGIEGAPWVRRVLLASAGVAVTVFVLWGLAEGGFLLLASQELLARAGAAAGPNGPRMVTNHDVGLAGLLYGAAGAVVGLLFGAVLAVAIRPRARGRLVSLRILTSWLGLAILAAFWFADRDLALRPETTQNPAWFARPTAVRLLGYGLFAYAFHRVAFLIGDLVTRPSFLAWLRHRYLRRALFLAPILGALALAATPSNRPPIERELTPIAGGTADADAPNVVVIVLDTVRPDHMSLYGYARPTTPELEAFAKRAVTFERAYSTSGWTLPSHASLFTGLYPSEHGAHGEHFRLEDDLETLAETLRAAGYRTWAASGNPMVGGVTNLDQGFERFVDTWREGRWSNLSLLRGLAGLVGIETDAGARHAVAFARRWLGEDDPRPFFLFVNLMEAHAPYTPPPALEERFLDGMPKPNANIYGDRFLEYMLGRYQIPADELEGIRRLYDGELAYLDGEVAELLALLRARPDWERTLVAVVADHGENLGEHRMMDHQLCLYETLIRIPMVIRFPGDARGGERVEDLVQLQDVFATALATAGLEPRGSARPLGPARPADARDRAVAEYQRPTAVLQMLRAKIGDEVSRFDRTLVAIVSGHWKLIHATDEHHELYDLATDPGEEHDLFAERPDEAARLAAGLAEWRAGLAPRARAGGGATALDLDDEAREQLRHLGYLE